MKFLFLHSNCLFILLFICKSNYYSAVDNIQNFSVGLSKDPLAIGLLFSTVVLFFIRGKKKNRKNRQSKLLNKLRRAQSSLDEAGTGLLILYGVLLVLLIIAIIIWFRVFLWIISIAAALFLIFLIIGNWDSWGEIVVGALVSLGLFIGIIYLIAFLVSTVALWGPWALGGLSLALFLYLLFNKKAIRKRKERKEERDINRKAKDDARRKAEDDARRKAEEQKQKENRHDNK